MSRTRQRGPWSLVAIGLLLAPSVALADQPAEGSRALLFTDPAPLQRDYWHRALSNLDRTAPNLTEDPEVFVGSTQAGITPASLSRLGEVEQLLAAAKLALGELAEDRALAILAVAERTARGILDVPGAAAWHAEVQLWIGVTAAQAQLPRLAEASLVRAASLDPERRLRAAEAPPAVVQMAAEIARREANAPTGRFIVRAEPADARVFLDDRPLGGSPAPVQSQVGLHVLRVEAPGHGAHGSLIEVLQGDRPEIAVTLAPNRAATVAARLRGAARQRDLQGVAEALAQLRALGAGPHSALVVETAPGGQRALLFRCTAAGCDAPIRLAAPAGSLGGSAAQLAAPADLESARDWLARTETRDPGPPTAWWQRWEVWTAVALVGAAAATTAVLATRSEPEPKLRVVIDPAGIQD